MGSRKCRGNRDDRKEIRIGGVEREEGLGKLRWEWRGGRDLRAARSEQKERGPTSDTISGAGAGGVQRKREREREEGMQECHSARVEGARGGGRGPGSPQPKPSQKLQGAHSGPISLRLGAAATPRPSLLLTLVEYLSRV